MKPQSPLITLKAHVSALEFCLSNELCFSDEDFIDAYDGRVKVPLCCITNDCRYHGQQVPDGRYICDFLLRELNNKKVANYLLAEGQNV